jgi:hypothetical protein
MTNELPGIKDIAWASLGTQLRDECAFSRRPGERRDPYAAAGVLRGAVRRLSRNNQSLWLWAFAGTTVEFFAKRFAQPRNFVSIARRILTVSLSASISTSLQRTTDPWAMSFFNFTRCANPIGSAPALRLVAAGISLPHTV